DSIIGKRFDHRAAEGALGVGHRDLDVCVPSPRSDLAPLRKHSGQVIGEDFEWNRPVGYGVENLAGECDIVRDTGFAHEGWVGREAFDLWVFGQLPHLIEISAVCKDLYLQRAHESSPGLERVRAFPKSRQSLQQKTKPRNPVPSDAGRDS